MTTAPRVLVVDDDDEIGDLLRDYLAAEGYPVTIATRGEEALAVLAAEPVDCAILDVMMPGLSGFELCRRIRERWDLPILFLSARQDDADKLRGLGLGADDYIVKTSSPAEVVARVKAVLRRYSRGQAPAPVRLELGGLSLDLTAREVQVDGEPVTLTVKEFDLLLLLAEHPRQVFTREQIVGRLWDGFADLQAVNGLVKRLRDKIDRDPTAPTYIATVWGVGYRFSGGAGT